MFAFSFRSEKMREKGRQAIIKNQSVKRKFQVNCKIPGYLSSAISECYSQFRRFHVAVRLFSNRSQIKSNAIRRKKWHIRR